jgi:hypothetical protein
MKFKFNKLLLTFILFIYFTLFSLNTVLANNDQLEDIISKNKVSFFDNKKEKIKEKLFVVDEKIKDLYSKTHEKVDQLLIKISDSFNKTDYATLELISSFYDRNIDRSFILYKGSFSGVLKQNFVNLDFASLYFQNSSPIGFDLMIVDFKLDRATNHLSFNFELDITIHYDTLYTEILSSGLEFIAAASIPKLVETCTNFLNEIPIDAIANELNNAVNKTFLTTPVKFSEDFVKSGLKNDFLFKSTNFWHVFTFGILTSFAHNIGSFSFTSIGAIVGTALVPGPGALVGAVIGKIFYKLFGKRVIRRITYLYSIDYKINRILKYKKALEHSYDVEKHEKFDKLCKNFFYSVKVETLKDDFRLFKRFLKKIKNSLSDEEIIMLKPIIQDILDFFKFKILQEQDWFYAKYYNEFKYILESKNLKSNFDF